MPTLSAALVLFLAALLGYSLTAVLLIENIRAKRGNVIIVPRANSSGFTHSDPQEGNPQRFEVPTPAGPRLFRLGSRLTNPVDQWPDPAVYINPAGQTLSGNEVRNLNRCYPGRADEGLRPRSGKRAS